MAPFDNPYSSNLTNKISPLLEGQLPDFIQSDHKVFARFLKHYYQYLEAGELQVTVSIDNLLLELETTSYALDVDGEKFVLESGTSETTGKFIVGETITGGTSKATATVLVDDLGHSTKPRMFITGQQQFQTGETITGSSSNATGTVVRYRANPVQNIQQLLEYANVDNTIYDFLDQLRESFMNAIPSELATGVNKRNLIKNIRELYRAKGTSEGHKIFMRMLLDENIDIVYPNKYMMRASDGKWTNQTILRCSPGVNAAADEMLGVVVTGQSSGATAVVANALSTAEGGDPIVIFEINPASLVGTFTDGETIQGTSTVQDVTMSFTVRGMVTGYTVTDGGKLYAAGDDLDLDTQTAIGNGEATAEVASIKTGSVSRVIIDDAGTNYRVGDTLKFTATESGTNTKVATGFVSVVGGSLEIDGTDSSSSDTGDNLILEAGSTSSLVNFDIVLDGHGQEATALTNGAVSSSTSLVLDGNSGTIVVGMTLSGKGISRNQGITVSTVTDQNNIVISSAVTLADNVNLRFDNIEDGAGDKLVLDRTDSGGANAGENIITHLTQESLDTYGTENDTFALEDGTVTTGEITRIYLKDGGEGYSLLPTVTSTVSDGNTVNGSGAALLADTNDIGAVDSVNITNQGFKYTEAPEGRFRANFILKDVTGTFATTNTLSSTGHTGVVKDWNSTTKVLKTTFEDVQRVTMETSDAEGIGLEDSLVVLADRAGETDFKLDGLMEGQGNTLLEDATAGVGRKILLDGTAEVGIDQLVLNGTDSSSTNAGERILAEGYQRPGFELGFITEAMGDANVSHAENATAITRRVAHKITLEDSPDIGESVIISEKGIPIFLETSPQIITGGFDDHSPLTQIDNRNRALFAIVENEAESLLIDNSIINGSEGDMRILLDGTDANGTDAGDNIISQSTGNSIVLNGTDGSSSDADDRLLGNLEALSGSIAIDGTNSSSAHAGDNIVNEEVPDFSAEGTTITDSGGATGTIVSVDIAKGTTLIGTKTETVPSYGVSIESLIGEDLNRIQDSVYYQQFSYEINAASSSADYATELKKALHPAGFNLFGKVSIATQVSMALPTVGSSLGGGYTSDTDTFSPILASTFNIVFQEKIQRRTGVLEYDVASFDDELLLESDETNIGGELLLDGTDGSSTDAGDKFISETLPNHFIDFEGIEITHGTGAGEVGALVDETTGDRIISESAVSSISEGIEITHSTTSGDTGVLLDETNGDKIITETSVSTSFTDNVLLEDGGLQSGGNQMPGFDGTTGGNLLLDGTDSSATNAGDKFELEIGIPRNENSFFTISLDTVRNTDTILSDAGGSIHLETSGKGDQANKEISFVSMVTTKVMLPRKQASSLPSGLITMAQQPFGSKSASIGLELGVVGGSGSGNLVLTGHNQVNLIGNVDGTSSVGEEIVFEDAADDNIGTGFTFSDFGKYTFNTMVLDGTDSSGSDAGDTIVLESSTLISGNILLDGSGYDFEITLEDGTEAGGSVLMESDEGNPFSSSDFNAKILGETASLQNTNSGYASNHEYPYVLIEDIIRQARFLADIDNGTLVNIVMEQDEIGSFKQEDGTTVSSTHGDSFLLEDETRVGYNNKLILEKQYLIPEDEVRNNSTYGFDIKGVIPSENYTNSSIEPYSYSSDIITRPMGVLSLEEEAREVTNIQLESGTEGGIFSNLLSDATGYDPNGVSINENTTIALEGFHDVRNLRHGGDTIILDRTATSGDFTNVGDDILLETATYYDNLLNTDKIAVPQTFENAFDSTSKTFDSSLLTWDSTL